MAYETFKEFMEENVQFQPVKHELMENVYRKQHDAFIAYVDKITAEKFSTKERYTHDELKALRLLVRDEIVEEMKDKYGTSDQECRYNLSESLVENRLNTYILAGLKP